VKGLEVDAVAIVGEAVATVAVVGGHGGCSDGT
jgi:hypothetical protein